MKKNIIYSLSLFLLLSLSACNQWLEVEPKTEIKSDKMFENETGFRDALIGCYMMMADSTLYGRESTVCFFDVLAQQYDMATNNPYNNLKQYRYESYTGTIDGIWQKTYRIIANLNALLEVSDEKKCRKCVSEIQVLQMEGNAAYLRHRLPVGIQETGKCPVGLWIRKRAKCFLF